jgi:hypothetical protein
LRLNHRRHAPLCPILGPARGVRRLFSSAWFLGWLFLALVLVGDSTAQAQAQAAGEAPQPRPAQLTDRGRVMVGLSLSAGVSDDKTTLYRRYDERWLTAIPSVVYFVRDCVGVGAYVGGGLRRGGFTDYYREAVAGLSALFDLRLSEKVGVYLVPSVGYGYESVGVTIQGPINFFTGQLQNGPRTFQLTRGTINTTVRIPLVYHPVPNLALGVGPEFVYDVFVHQRDPLGTEHGSTRYRLSLVSYLASSF